MKRTLFCLMLLSSILSIHYANGQKKSAGPIIPNFGEVYEVKEPDFKIDTENELKVVFDIWSSPKSNEDLNRSIETAARFLNMHAQSGVLPENLKVALVVHGRASKDITNDEAYKKGFGTSNPNKELINDLLKAGGQVILCGQSAASRGVAKENMIEGVQLSLSAMTALVQLQNAGYRLIKF